MRRGKRRPHSDRHILSGQQIGDKVALRAMLQSNVHIKFARDAQRREHIVRLMRVRFEWDLSA